VRGGLSGTSRFKMGLHTNHRRALRAAGSSRHSSSIDIKHTRGRGQCRISWFKYCSFEFNGLIVEVDGLQWDDSEIDLQVSLWRRNVDSPHCRRSGWCRGHAAPASRCHRGRLNQIMRGWSAYFRHAVAKHTMNSLENFVWHRVIRWFRKLHRWNGRDIRRHHTDLHGRWTRPSADGIELFNLASVPITRYRYRGNTIPNPWTVAHPA
jgi:hypothetical protein